MRLHQTYFVKDKMIRLLDEIAARRIFRINATYILQTLVRRAHVGEAEPEGVSGRNTEPAPNGTIFV